MSPSVLLTAVLVLGGALSPPNDPVPALLTLERFDPARVLLEDESCRDERPRHPQTDLSEQDVIERASRARLFGRPIELDAPSVSRILSWCARNPDYLGQTVQELPRDAATRAEVRRQLARYRALHAATRHHLDNFADREKQVVDWLRDPGPLPRVSPPAQLAREVAALVRIAEDRARPRGERVSAISSVMEMEPFAHEAWYLARYADESLLPPMDDHGQVDPLMQPVVSRPDRWVPRIVQLLDPHRRAQHTLATACLALFNSERFRADAMTALLPWLEDPKWSAAPNIWRIRLIQACDVKEMRAAVPGLLKVAEREEGFELADSARALIVHRVREAAPVVKRGFERECSRAHESTLFVRTAQLGGWTFRELEAGLRAFATALARGTMKRGDPRYDPEFSLKPGPCPSTAERVGRQVDHWLASDGLCVDELEAHRENLVSTALSVGGPPELQRALRGLVLEWPSRYGDAYLMAQLSAGRATAGDIAAILHRRRRLVAHCGYALTRLADGRGWGAGVAAAVLGPRELELALTAGDDAAVGAALGCARLLRRALPLDRLRSLAPRAGVRAALAAYLSAQFGGASLDALGSGGRVLLGRWFDPFDPIEARQLAAAERAVVASLDAPGGPDRVDALLEGSGPSVVVEHRGSTATLRVVGPGARALVRPLGAAEIAAVKALAPDFTREYDRACEPGTQHGGCSDSEYLSVERSGGRRQRMSSLAIHRGPPHGSPGAAAVDLLFRKLRDSGSFRVTYPPGVRVLAGGEAPKARDEGDLALMPRTVWAGFGGVRALVADGEGHAGYWARVAGGQLEPRTAEPADCPVFAGLGLDEALPVPGRTDWTFDRVQTNDFGYALRLLHGGAVQFQLPPFAHRVCGDPATGVWMHESYDSSVGDAIQIREHGAAGRRVSVPGKGYLHLLGWQPAREATLAARIHLPEFIGGTPRGVLLGHVPGSTVRYFEISRNGNVAEVHGEMWPLVHATFRDLQPARGGGQWAALPDAQGTVVGRYDRSSYRFQPVARFAGLQFESLQMWVDEAVGRVLAAHGGEVIQVQLVNGK